MSRNLASMVNWSCWERGQWCADPHSLSLTSWVVSSFRVKGGARCTVWHKGILRPVSLGPGGRHSGSWGWGTFLPSEDSGLFDFEKIESEEHLSSWQSWLKMRPLNSAVVRSPAKWKHKPWRELAPPNRPRLMGVNYCCVPKAYVWAPEKNEARAQLETLTLLLTACKDLSWTLSQLSACCGPVVQWEELGQREGRIGKATLSVSAGAI